MIKWMLFLCLTVSPVGAGMLTLCQIGEAFNLNPHHHIDELSHGSVCTEDAEGHHQPDEAPPCPDECQINPIDFNILSFSSSERTLPVRLVLLNPTRVIKPSDSITVHLEPSGKPPNHSDLRCRPEFSGKFLR